MQDGQGDFTDVARKIEKSQMALFELSEREIYCVRLVWLSIWLELPWNGLAHVTHPRESHRPNASLKSSRSARHNAYKYARAVDSYGA